MTKARRAAAARKFSAIGEKGDLPGRKKENRGHIYVRRGRKILKLPGKRRASSSFNRDHDLQLAWRREKLWFSNRRTQPGREKGAIDKRSKE